MSDESGEWRRVSGTSPLFTPEVGLPATGPGRRRPARSPIAVIAASGAGVFLAVGLVAALVLRDGTTDRCTPAAALGGSTPVAAAGPVVAAAPPIDTSWTDGKITYYGPASTDGACLASSVPSNRYTVALGPSEYAGGAACGTYVDLRGPRGTIRAKVTNLCPECSKGHLDLSDEAFAALDDPAKGVAQIEYRAVRNPSVGALTVQVKDGSNAWWLALRIDNHGNPLESVEVRAAGGSWRSMALQDYGYWLLDSGAGNGPFRVRVTDVLGHTATVKGITLSPGAVQTTGVRLYGSGAAASQSPTADRTTTARTPKASKSPKATKTAATPSPRSTSPTGTATPSVTADAATDDQVAPAPTSTPPADDDC